MTAYDQRRWTVWSGACRCLNASELITWGTGAAFSGRFQRPAGSNGRLDGRLKLWARPTTGPSTRPYRPRAWTGRSAAPQGSGAMEERGLRSSIGSTAWDAAGPWSAPWICRATVPQQNRGSQQRRRSDGEFDVCSATVAVSHRRISVAFRRVGWSTRCRMGRTRVRPRLPPGTFAPVRGANVRDVRTAALSVPKLRSR
jgi:hypothetical protein